MKRKLVNPVILILLLSLYPFLIDRTTVYYKKEIINSENLVALPSSFLKLTSLEFDGVLADYMLLEAMTFIGGATKRTEKPQVKEWEWEWLYRHLNAATDLDPRFLDFYYFANAHLTWGGDKIEEANRLLDKGIKNRPDQWLLPFFAGFNLFYFRGDNSCASEYLMLAAKDQTAPVGIARLASLLAYKSNQTKNAIVFLKQIIRSTEDPVMKDVYEKRLILLESINLVEEALGKYKATYNQLPKNLEELIEKNFLSEIPVEPYGGSIYIEDDQVRSTSLIFTK